MKLSPFIPIKEVIFPGVITTIFIGREKSVQSLEVSLLSNNKLLLFLQRNKEQNNPNLPKDIYTTGVIVNIIQSVKLPDGIVRALVESEKRVKLANIIDRKEFYKAEYEEVVIPKIATSNEEAIRRKVLEEFEAYLRSTNKISPELVVGIKGIKNISKLFDLIASNMNVSMQKKQDILETLDVEERGYKLLAVINEEVEMLNLEKRIDSKVKDQMSSLQKNYILKEKIKVLKEELGEEGNLMDDTDDLKQAIEDAKLPSNIRSKMESEVLKLQKMPPFSSEFSVVRNYVETVLELPWHRETKDSLNIKKAEKILNKNHFGLEKVKERILEFLAVKQLNKNLKGSILCLAGPPGVGKTSLAKSIAESLKRKFARISLGGIKDESEIRGHRRTYIGAMPGRIIKELKHVNANNPVILLDEIDKMGYDFRGDPSSALLEVLDPEQNKDFVDNYLDVPFDLSNVFFISTANDISNIPPALKDRLEIIDINSYTDVEKLHIAQLYLVSQSIKESGLTNLKSSISEKVIYKIIHEYTREAGVRNLKRNLDKIFRKIAKMKLEKNLSRINLTTANLKKYLGIPKFLKDKLRIKEGKVGVVNGLAWTPVGGSTLEVQSSVMKGKGKLLLTGKLGEVMQESAKVAKSFIRSIAKDFKISEKTFLENDIHIHFPEGATPKDGPSAGIAIVSSMVSALSNRKIRQDIAMTGEITIIGEVLPVGGIKEKVIGAHRANIREVVLPIENKPNVEELPKEIAKDMKFYFAKNYQDVADKIFFDN